MMPMSRCALFEQEIFVVVVIVVGVFTFFNFGAHITYMSFCSAPFSFSSVFISVFI